MPGALGRNVPPDWKHLERYPLTAEHLTVPAPVVVGVNWYTAFDSPKEIDGGYHLPDVAKGEELGNVRGGHCFCLEPMGAVKTNTEAVWVFYNQGQEGACVGFGNSHAQTLLTGKTFDAFWLYDDARRVEGAYPNQDGSTVRAACSALQKWGVHAETGEVCTRTPWHEGDRAVQIKTYRWTQNAQLVCEALGRQNALAVPFVNSWGRDYPEVCWLPVATLERLLNEQGEAVTYTDS